jgi:tetratricopeptide (TPR) repeat protein
MRPLKRFYDRPRQRWTYLQAYPYEGRVVKVQDMMMDEIVIENKWRYPIYFTSQPYEESPLKLRERTTTVGILYKLEREPHERLIDAERSYDLFMNTYHFEGYENSEVYRDDNATGVFLGVGMNALRLFDELIRTGQKDKAMAIGEKMLAVYPEYWQIYLVMAEVYQKEGDSAKAGQLFQQLHDTLAAFYESNKENLFYLQDLGVAKGELGRMRQDPAMIEDGIRLMWAAYEGNPNSNYAFRKLVSMLSQAGRHSDVQRAAQIFAQYKINLTDPVLQSIQRMSNFGSTQLPGQ